MAKDKDSVPIHGLCCETVERSPYPEVEYQGRRVYVQAHEP